MTTHVLRLIAILQIALGIGYLFFADSFSRSMGFSTPPADLHYPLAMLAARFLAYGAGLWWASSNLGANLPWVRLMALIQGIDLAAGLFYTATGIVPITLSAFPMFNAVWIGLTCLFVQPRNTPAV